MNAWSVVAQAAVVGPLRRAPGRTVLAIIAIALGVALGFAIYLINRTAADEMSQAARNLFGLADLAVEASAGSFDEALYPRIALLEGVAVASPVLRIEAKLGTRRGALTLLGVDAFRSRQLQPAWAGLAMTASTSETSSSEPSDPDDQQILLSASAARLLDLRAGDTVALQVGLQSSSWRIAAVLPNEALREPAGVIDIATAQWKFAKLGQLTRIDLRLASGANAARLRTQLERLLPANTRITTPGSAEDEALRLSSAYRSNLTALALVALFTGGFLVYSTQSLTVLRRRRELALLHALGATRAQQIGWILCGGALVGVGGALLGVLLGATIAKVAISSLGSALGGGYVLMLGELQVAPLEGLLFCALGSGVALLGSLQPALDAARIPTAAALKAGDVASGVLSSHHRLALGMVALAIVCLMLPPLGRVPLPGYVAIGLLVIASMLLMPTLLRTLFSWLPAPTVPLEIAVSHLRGTARYVNLSISAILVSFSLMVAMLIMVSSFRNSLDLWTQRLLPADLYVRSGYIEQSAAIDAATLDALARLPSVARLEAARVTRIALAAERPAVALVARPISEQDAEDRLWLRSRASQRAPSNTVAVWVSEAAADLYDLEPDGSLQFEIGATPVRASIRGVWRDYEHQSGAVLMDRGDYVRLSGDAAVNTVSFWLTRGTSETQAQQQIRDTLPGVQMDMRTPGELRRLSLQAFDRTFAITYLLELVAVIIGLLGISASTSAQVLARRGEFGLLRHLGLTRAQIGGTLAFEGLLLGVGGVLAGLINGVVIGAILIYVVNRQSFHWSMDLFVPYLPLVGLSCLLLAAAAVIAVLSGRRAMSGDVVRAVKEDW